MTNLHKTFAVSIVALGATLGVVHAQPAPAPAPAPVVAAATPAAPRSLVIHIAPASTPANQPVELEAMIDAPFSEKLSVRWRALGETKWTDVLFERSSAGGWFASL